MSMDQEATSQAMASGNGKCTMVELRQIMEDTVPTYCKKEPPRKQPYGGVTMFVSRDFSRGLPTNSYDEVYKNIILGDQYLAKKKDELQKLRVTHVVNTAAGKKFCQIDTDQDYYSDIDIKFHGFSGSDTANYKIKEHLKAAADFIEKGLQSNGTVFVHCHMGMSRSATVVIAYLMLKKRMRVQEAVRTIRLKRAVWPNDGFLKQLCALDEELFCDSEENCLNQSGKLADAIATVSILDTDQPSTRGSNSDTAEDANLQKETSIGE